MFATITNTLRNFSTTLILAVIALATPAVAYADAVEPLFFEDFEGYSSFSNNENAGIPLISEGAKEEWFGGRFETGDGGTINSDLSVWRLPSVYPDNITFGQVEDDAGLLFHVSTIGVANPMLSFQWKTHQTETSDRFVAGYYVGDIDFVNDTADGSPNSRVHRFNEDGPSWSGGGWVELLRSRNNSNWTTSEYALPANQPHVWVAFWMDNGEGDLGKVDNIVVTPEPMTGALLLAAGVVVLRRRR